MTENLFDPNPITITSVKRIHGRAVLILSDGASLSMPRSMLKERPYKGGMPFDRQSFDAFLSNRAYPFAMEKAVSLLASRSRTEKEIVDVLMRCAYPEEAIARVMAYLTEAGYISDSEFAGQWTAARTAKGLGSRRIRMELKHKGVSQEEIDEALSGISEEDLFSSALRSAEKAARGKDLNAPAERKKALDAMARRGFDYSIAKRALDAIRTRTL